ncbi:MULTISPECIES: elongation factor P [Myxococcus]|uniref:Elongation factor P n=1 Tax=Myxococcus llanfairpwllgwyngyllgogerychwyrndrobwllllantysiliogogogochensis TaxID=2590453 RepID=A0A540X2J9_9BACT|nr:MULTISPECIES: elongation factor P [Myxococcus]NTX00606.1 elongation factor P [Myxococcus sp. CA040A]NTX12692.1 elongation factor P [Myxococcus sp. CA056]NTX33711.1 elongation factor P [Myxococcus sp. CA033]TQF15450.1 elongation factor P [Myxococcus llanfairpwllgwyngyllgogerychwyrndrobwllllantysiliogogogochensis]
MAGFIDTSEFHNNMKIEIDGEPFVIVEFQHVKPGKGSAFVRTKIRSLLSGRVLQPTLKSGEKVGKPDIEEKDMQYLYVQGDDYYFMDKRDFEQTFISEKALGDAKNFLKENIDATILFWNGKAIAVTLPNSVDLKVVKCDPGVRGDTVSGALKPATLETGFEVYVPLFINEGDVLKIDTRDGGKYLTRVATAG